MCGLSLYVKAEHENLRTMGVVFLPSSVTEHGKKFLGHYDRSEEIW